MTQTSSNLHAIAAVSRDHDIRARAELLWPNTKPFAQQGRLGRRIFGAKKFTHNCDHTVSGVSHEFQALESSLSGGNGAFLARFAKDARPFLTDQILAGHCVAVSGHILSLMAMAERGQAIETCRLIPHGDHLWAQEVD